MSRGTKFICLTALVIVGVFASTANAGRMDAVNIIGATVSPDRHLTVTWDMPAGQLGGSIAVATKPDTGTDGDFFQENQVDFDLVLAGQTTFTSSWAFDKPGTYYVRVALIDSNCTSGTFGVECQSQVVPVTVDPICTTVIVTPSHVVKRLVRKGHYVRRNGHRVWIKPVFRRVTIPAVTTQSCR